MAIMEHVNGSRPRGRAVSSLGEHTFKDSGITIGIRKVGPTTQQRTQQAVRLTMPEPEPPRNPPDSEAAQLGETFNRADPEYERAYAAWQQDAAIEISRRLMLLAALEAEVVIDDTIRQEVARRRRHMEIASIPYEDAPDLDDDERTRVFYVLQIACATPDDLNEFGAAVLQRSVPTEEAVARHIATFPGDVPGPGRLSIPPDPTVGD